MQRESSLEREEVKGGSMQRLSPLLLHSWPRRAPAGAKADSRRDSPGQGLAFVCSGGLLGAFGRRGRDGNSNARSALRNPPLAPLCSLRDATPPATPLGSAVTSRSRGHMQRQSDRLGAQERRRRRVRMRVSLCAEADPRRAAAQHRAASAGARARRVASSVPSSCALSLAPLCCSL